MSLLNALTFLVSKFDIVHYKKHDGPNNDALFSLLFIFLKFNLLFSLLTASQPSVDGCDIKLHLVSKLGASKCAKSEDLLIEIKVNLFTRIKHICTKLQGNEMFCA